MKRVIYFEFKANQEQQLILRCLTYATSKLWNVGNYERKKWMKENGDPYPDWYRQKKALKDHFWYKALPSQSAQEVLKQLHEGWKSFYTLKRTGGIENPKPPRFKHQPFNIRFLNHGFRMQDQILRLSLPKQLRKHLAETEQKKVKYLYIPIPKAYSSSIGNLKMIEIMPLENKYKVNMIVEFPSEEKIDRPAIEKYMSIDIGVNNLMACYLSTGKSFIVSGRQLLSINRYFDKTIHYYQGILYAEQATKGIQYHKPSKRIRKLYEKRRKQVHHLIHAATKRVVDIAVQEGITKVIIGDISKIREEKNLGKKNNQKFHRLPYRIMDNQLAYKLEEHHIELEKQEESYTSQCSPYSKEVTKEYAKKNNRKHRGLYVVDGKVMNADCVGAYNILRKYLCRNGRPYPAVVALDTPVMYRWNHQGFIVNPKLAILMAM